MHFSPTATTITFSIILCLARTEDHRKRAPSGFTGVRGKKSIGEEAKNVIYFDEDSIEDGGGRNGNMQVSISPLPLQFVNELDGDVSKRAPSMGFVGMRGKKPWDVESGFYGGDSSERMPKRAPNGFFGMRGKKDFDEDAIYDLEKRVHAGFFGMRGKKDNALERSYYMSDKRAPSMGFVGMRGRKSFEDSGDELEKRAPSGFFGMRGKKQWGQFALRGKKIPYQFRGKFVGVRGKKTVTNEENMETELSNDSEMNRLLMQLLEDENLQKTGSDVL